MNRPTTRQRTLRHGAHLRLAFQPLCATGADRAALLAGPTGRTLLRPVRPLEHHVALTVRAGDTVILGGPSIRAGSRSVAHAHTHLHLTAPVTPVPRPASHPAPRSGRLSTANERPAPMGLTVLPPAPGAAPVPLTDVVPTNPDRVPRLEGQPRRPSSAPSRPATALSPVSRPSPLLSSRDHGTGHITTAPVPRHVARPGWPAPPTGGADLPGVGPSAPWVAPFAPSVTRGPDRCGAPAQIDVEALTRQVIAGIERRQLADGERHGHGPGA